MVPQSGFELHFSDGKGCEHFLKCLSAISEASVENCLFSSAPHFFNSLFGVLVASILSSLYSLEISPLSDVGLMNIFSHSLVGRVVLLTVSFAMQKLLSFRKSQLLIEDLTVCATGPHAVCEVEKSHVVTDVEQSHAVCDVKQSLVISDIKHSYVFSDVIQSHLDSCRATHVLWNLE